jgi:hypothetical protein
LLLVMLSGCDDATIMKQWTKPEEEQLAKRYLNLLQQNSIEQIEKDLDQSIKSPSIHDNLVKMAGLFPPQEPRSVKVVGAHSLIGSDFYRSNITFEYEYPDRWLLANVAVQKKAGATTIVGIGVVPVPDALEKTNKFTLTGKNGLQYTVFAFALLVPLFTLYVLVLCIRTKVDKRKWLWILFILFGIGQFTIDWTSGLWNFKPVAGLLFGAGIFSQPYAPWTIAVSFPLGAIVFLFWRKRRAGAAPSQLLGERTDESSSLDQ